MASLYLRACVFGSEDQQFFRLSTPGTESAILPVISPNQFSFPPLSRPQLGISGPTNVDGAPSRLGSTLYRQYPAVARCEQPNFPVNYRGRAGRTSEAARCSNPTDFTGGELSESCSLRRASIAFKHCVPP